MRVGIDYLPAATHWPGVGRYARELVRALVRLEGAPELRLLDVGGERRTIGEPALGLAGHESRFRRRSARVPRRAAALLRRAGLGADRLLGGVDVFHRILPTWPPVSRAVTTLAVGELPPEGSAAEAELARALLATDHLLVASRHAERELARRFDLPAERVHFVSLGCDHWRRELDPEAADAAGGAADPPSLLVLGSLRPERRHADVLAAFEALLARGAASRLVVVGGGAASDRERFASKLRFSPARDAVQWIERPVEADLPRIVARAGVLVHLSQGEQTAVTPLEAFSFGTAVVTGPGGPFEEALGAEACYFDATRKPRVDAAELARVVGRALETAADPAARARRRAVAAPFTWADNARRTADVWRALGGA